MEPGPARYLQGVGCGVAAPRAGRPLATLGASVHDLGTLDDLSVLETFGPWVGQDVLDAGCGGGHLVRGLGAWGAFVTGLEPDPRSLARAREQGVPSGSRLLQGSAHALPLTPASQDVVIFNRSLHHVPADRMDLALHEALRVLRRQGRLLVLEPDIEGQMSKVMEPFHDERAARIAALSAVRRLRAAQVASYRYLREYRYPDLRTFQARMFASGIAGHRMAALHSDLVAARFEAGLDPAGEGEGRYRFTNPITVLVIPRAAVSLAA